MWPAMLVKLQAQTNPSTWKLPLPGVFCLVLVAVLFPPPPTTKRRTTFILPMSSQLPFVFGLRWWLLPLFGISPAHSSCCLLNSALDSLAVHAKFLGSGGSISIYLGFLLLLLLDSLVILRQTFIFQEGLRVPLSLAFCFWQCVSLISILEGTFLTLYTYPPTVLGVTFSELWLWGNVRLTLVPLPPPHTQDYFLA